MKQEKFCRRDDVVNVDTLFFAFLIISSSTTQRTKEMSSNFAYFYHFYASLMSDCRRKEKKNFMV